MTANTHQEAQLLQRHRATRYENVKISSLYAPTTLQKNPLEQACNEYQWRPAHEMSNHIPKITGIQSSKRSHDADQALFMADLSHKD